MSRDEFSLNDLIASVQDAVGPDPHDIAANVEPLIPESERHGVFLMLLARYIVNTKPRLTQVMGAVPNRGEPAQRGPAGPTQAKAMPAKSAKVAAYQAYGRLLKLSVKVGPSERKFMEDCTHEDLTFAALIRREQSARSEAAAAQYEELAALLKKHKASTVGKLPTRVLDEFLRRDWSAA